MSVEYQVHERGISRHERGISEIFDSWLWYITFTLKYQIYMHAIYYKYHANHGINQIILSQATAYPSLG